MEGRLARGREASRSAPSPSTSTFSSRSTTSTATRSVTAAGVGRRAAQGGGAQVDVTARVGGEEFFVLLPGADEEAALVFAGASAGGRGERPGEQAPARRAVGAPRLTISAGVASATAQVDGRGCWPKLTRRSTRRRGAAQLHRRRAPAPGARGPRRQGPAAAVPDGVAGCVGGARRRWETRGGSPGPGAGAKRRRCGGSSTRWAVGWERVGDHGRRPGPTWRRRCRRRRRRRGPHRSAGGRSRGGRGDQGVGVDGAGGADQDGGQ